MRFYEKQSNGSIELVDFSKDIFKTGAIVFYFNAAGDVFYQAAFAKADVIHLHDIRTVPFISLLPSYHTYNPTTKILDTTQHIENKNFRVPMDYRLTNFQQSCSNFLEKINEIKEEVAQLARSKTFFDLVLQEYHKKTLSRLEKALFTGDLAQLQQFLKTQWAVICNTNVCYTSLPNDPITLLFCDIAEFLQKEINKTKTGDERIAAIELLMPDIATESQNPDSFQNLTEINLRDIIRTHILGPKALYLVPVAILTSDNTVATFDLHRLVSPYYDHQKHGENAYLDPATVYRLKKFSLATEALFDAKDEFTKLADDNNNLLSQLIRLVDFLKFGSSHGGVGTSDEAATAAFTAIINFFPYYKMLPDVEKNKIPLAVKDEIVKIYRFSISNEDDNEKYVDHRSLGDTCVGSLGEGLDYAMKIGDHYRILSTISINGESKEELLHGIMSVFSHNKTEIQRSVIFRDCFGKDHLGVTRDLLVFLNIMDKYHIKNDKILDEFLRLPKAEIVVLCQEIVHLQSEIKILIGNLENLVMLFLNTPEEGIRGLFDAMGREIINEKNGLIRSLDDVMIFLQPFENHRIEFILDVIAPEKFIQDYRQLKMLLACQQLPSQYRTKILTDFSNRLSSWIQNGHQLRDFMNLPLTTEQYEIIWKAATPQFPALFNNGYDLSFLLKLPNLLPPQRMQIWNVVFDRLSTLITTGYIFRDLWQLQYWTAVQRTQIWNAVSNRWPAIIQNNEQLYYLLQQPLTACQYSEILTAVFDKLSTFIWQGKVLLDFLQLPQLTVHHRAQILAGTFKQSSSRIESWRYYDSVVKIILSQELNVITTHLNQMNIDKIMNIDGIKTYLNLLAAQYAIRYYFEISESRASISFFNKTPIAGKSQTAFKMLEMLTNKNFSKGLLSAEQKEAMSAGRLQKVSQQIKKILNPGNALSNIIFTSIVIN